MIRTWPGLDRELDGLFVGVAIMQSPFVERDGMWYVMCRVVVRLDWDG